MSTIVQLPPRDAVDPTRTWDAYSIFPSDAAWEEAIATLDAAVDTLSAYAGTLGESPQRLADYFAEAEPVIRLAGKVMVYASMFITTDSGNQAAVAKAGRSQGILAKLGASNAFVEPEIMTIGAETLAQWVESEPRLADFEHYFDRLARKAEHVRSAEVEEVLAQAADPLVTGSRSHGILTNTDLEFEPVVDGSGATRESAQGTIRGLMHDPEREVRRQAWENYADGHLKFQNTLANCLSAQIKRDVFTARVRRYPSSLAASLGRNSIPTAVFHNTVEAFTDNLHVWHRYFDVRRRAMGLDKLAPYDMWAPLGAAPPTVSYEQGVEWVAEGMAPLGEEYVGAMRQGCLTERWVDVYPNRGKRQGAFSSGSPGTYPFILMSWAENMHSVSTLAHELGHSMHSYYAWKTQPTHYARYSLFVAEVASNFNQALVRDYLFRTNSDREFQIALLEEAMENYYRYFFIMPTLARFELEVHERVEQGRPLTASSLNALTADLFQEGYGAGVEADYDRSGITWATFQHMYMNFYVYQYTTGIAAAHALAEPVLQGNAAATEKYLAFLSAGGSEYPLDLLAETGIDMTSPEPVNTAFGILEGYVDRLEQLLLS